MRYLDTSVVISAANPEDSNHKRALNLLKCDEKIISNLVKVELYSVLSRTTGATGEELDALVEYMIEVSGAELKPVDWKDVFSSAYSLAGELRLKSLDLLHVMAAFKLRSKEFATLDNDPIKRKEKIRKLTGMIVIGGD